MLFKKILEIVFGGIEGKISYVEFHVFEFWGNSLPATSRCRESGFKSPTSQTQLTIYQAKKQNRLNPMAGSVVHRSRNSSRVCRLASFDSGSGWRPIVAVAPNILQDGRVVEGGVHPLRKSYQERGRQFQGQTPRVDLRRMFDTARTLPPIETTAHSAEPAPLRFCFLES